MSKKKPFNTRSFKEFAGAIYEMHRTLVDIKRIFKIRENFEEAKSEVAHEYADRMEMALGKVSRYGKEWLAQIKEE